jgi:hypothetical protein
MQHDMPLRSQLTEATLALQRRTMHTVRLDREFDPYATTGKTPGKSAPTDQQRLDQFTEPGAGGRYYPAGNSGGGDRAVSQEH